MRQAPPTREAEVVWHEVECGGYAADLELWERLARDAEGPVLELGCGTGRVLSHMAGHGHDVHGLDRDPRLVAELPTAQPGDAKDFDLRRKFALILAPMQLAQLLAGEEERIGCLRCVAAHLEPGGIAAFAIVERMPAPSSSASPLPDTREVEGWVYSSLPVESYVGGGEIRVRRLRQMVAPDGKLTDELHEVVLRELDAATLEEEARRVGLAPLGRRTVPPTEDHVGSTVVLLEAA